MQKLCAFNLNSCVNRFISRLCWKRFEIITIVTPCSLIERSKCLGKYYYRHVQSTLKMEAIGSLQMMAKLDKTTGCQIQYDSNLRFTHIFVVLFSFLSCDGFPPQPFQFTIHSRDLWGWRFSVIDCTADSIRYRTMYSVGTATGYRLDSRGIAFLAEVGYFSLHYSFQIGSKNDPASYLMGNGWSFLGGKAVGAST